MFKDFTKRYNSYSVGCASRDYCCVIIKWFTFYFSFINIIVLNSRFCIIIEATIVKILLWKIFNLRLCRYHKFTQLVKFVGLSNLNKTLKLKV